MSSELRDAIKHAAPGPQRPLDEKRLSSRARRLTATRAVAVVVALAIVGGGIALATGDGSPRIQPAEHGNEAPDVPDGPRHEVLSGRYGDDWATGPGQEWRLLVWGEGHTHCWQVATTDAPPPREGLSCSAPAAGQELEDEPFMGSMSFYTQSSDPSQFWFVAGVLSPRVEVLEFRSDRGDVVEIEVVDGPQDSGPSLRYYAATLPAFDSADMVALDAEGQVLETHHICGPGCQAEREAEDQRNLTAWEAEPVTTVSKAAAFANLAVGSAGLADVSGTFLAYEEVEPGGEGFRVAFAARECDPTRTYQCEEELGSAYIDVSVDGRRFEVAAVDGPLTKDERDDLLSYVRNDDFGPYWEESQTSILQDPGGDRAVMYSLVWMGNLAPPVSDYGSLCRAIVLDEQGGLIYEGRPLPAEVRRDEYARVYSPMTELESDEEVGEINVECDEPRPNLVDRFRDDSE